MMKPALFVQLLLTACVYHREIVETMVKAYKQRFFNGQMPVFDGRKNMYSRDPLPIGREKVCFCKFIQILLEGITFYA